MLSALDRKLFRDLSNLKGQLFTIALVVASGIAAFVASQGAVDSLTRARDSFYGEQQFADVWADLERAPLSVARRLEAIDGVALVETRVVDRVSSPLPDRSEPARLTIVSMPPDGPRLNGLYLRRGRLPLAHRTDEVVLSDAFASANDFDIGDTLPMVLGGVLRTMKIVGVGLSPEHVMIIDAGDISVDNRQRGAAYMNDTALAAALNREGAFNNAVFRLTPDANLPDVLDAINRILKPYGGFEAVERKYQSSHFMLGQELSQLKNMVKQVPPLFLFVAAFLLHVVLGRLVHLQRSQIAALKALGYSNAQIGTHYLKLASIIVLSGALLGFALGQYLGAGLVGLYAEYFRFPALQPRIAPQSAAIALIVSTAAAALGTLTSVRSVLKLAPAEAMRPPAPANYRRGFGDLPFVRRFIGPAAQMVLREIQRRPIRLILSSVGIAVAIGIMVVARFFGDSMSYLVDVHMHQANAWDTQIMLRRPRPLSSLRSFEHLPGVYYAEGQRYVPARFRSGSRHRTLAIKGYDPSSELQRLLDMQGQEVAVPEDGLLLTTLLGEILDVQVGDEIEVEILDGDRPTLRIPVAAFVDEPFGLNAHMNTITLHRLLGEEPSADVIQLRTDPEQNDALDAELTTLRDVLGITHKERMISAFRDQGANNIRVFSLVLTFFAMTIAIGVVYNNARVSLSSRARDLGSLRVLGFTRAEISSILLGELAVQVFMALPIGLLFGRFFAQSMMNGAADPELFRLPLIISSGTYAFATVTTLAAALISALLVRRKLDRLDLIGVLKTRE